MAASRIYREPCGVPGCGYVAGPSRDQNRVMRLADGHRARGHVLDAEALAGGPKRRRAAVAGSEAEYKRQARARTAGIVPHLATYRRFEVDDWHRPSEWPRRQRAQERRRLRRRAELASLLPPPIQPQLPPEVPWRGRWEGQPRETTEERRARRHRAAERKRRERAAFTESVTPTLLEGLRRGA